MVDEPDSVWTLNDASELYHVPRWGNGYFSVQADGHVHVHPDKDPQRSIDLKKLVDRLQMRGLNLPILLRFNGILRNRLMEIRPSSTRRSPTTSTRASTAACIRSR